MIKAENEHVRLEGTPVELCTELTGIVRSMVHCLEKPGILDREGAVRLIKKSFSLGLKTEEEVKEEAKQVMQRSFEDFLKIMFGDLEKEGEK